MASVKAWLKRNDDGTFGVLLFTVLLPPLLVGLLWAASVASDNSRVPAALAAAAQESGVMVCADGTIDHGNYLLTRMFGEGRFRCTSWRMRARPVDPETGTTMWPTSPKR